MTAVILDFQAARKAKRLKEDPEISRVYRNLTDASANKHVPDHILVKWATMLAKSNEKTLPEIVNAIEQEMDAVGFKF